jgi:Galactose oxidase, central domain
VRIGAGSRFMRLPLCAALASFLMTSNDARSQDMTRVHAVSFTAAVFTAAVAQPAAPSSVSPATELGGLAGPLLPPMSLFDPNWLWCSNQPLAAGAIPAGDVAFAGSECAASPIGQTATLLPDGTDLFVGGLGRTGPVSSAFIAGSSSYAKPLESGLTFPRAWHTATLLPDGSVLVVGGIGPDGLVVSVAEVFDPSTQTVLFKGARFWLSCSSPLCDETRDACFHHIIESLPGLNTIDFVQCILRKGSDVKILSRAGRGFGCGKQGRAALNRPRQQDLCRRLSNSCGDCRNDRIFEQPRPHSVAQWRESQKHNAIFFAEFQKLRFRQIGM